MHSDSEENLNQVEIRSANLLAVDKVANGSIAEFNAGDGECCSQNGGNGNPPYVSFKWPE